MYHVLFIQSSFDGCSGIFLLLFFTWLPSPFSSVLCWNSLRFPTSYFLRFALINIFVPLIVYLLSSVLDCEFCKGGDPVCFFFFFFGLVVLTIFFSCLASWNSVLFIKVYFYFICLASNSLALLIYEFISFSVFGNTQPYLLKYCLCLFLLSFLLILWSNLC